jgi:hypothetical protein
MRTLNAVGGIASIVGLGLAVALIPGVAGWLYPLPVIVILAVSLTASWVFFALRLRSPDPHEQERLNKLFAVLSSEAMRRIGDEDFGAPWPQYLTYPVQFFLHELQGAECRFRSRALEKRRSVLVDAAVAFADAEALNGFGHPIAWDRRHTGFIEGELEIERDKLVIANRRRSLIYSTANAFVDAHEKLVEAAKRRGFSLAALDGKLIEPPWKAEMEEETRQLRREFSGSSRVSTMGPRRDREAPPAEPS